jgi:hypothetical protein
MNLDLCLCHASVYSLYCVPIEGQCSVNIQREMFVIYAMLGTICYWQYALVPDGFWQRKKSVVGLLTKPKLVTCKICIRSVWSCVLNKVQQGRISLRQYDSCNGRKYPPSDMVSDRTDNNLQQRCCKNLQSREKSLSVIPSSFPSAKYVA